MSVRFESELGRLRSQGVGLADLTPGEVVALVRACDRCDSPFSSVNAEAAGFPVEVVEGVHLWRLTAGAIVWLDEYAGRWWPAASKPFFWATVYAMRHAREREAFACLTGEDAAYCAIRDEILSIPATEEELVAAIEKLWNRDGAPAKNPRIPQVKHQAEWAKVARRLEVATGLPASYWMWEESAAYTVGAHSDMVEWAVASGGGKTERMRDELDAAISALARLEAAIIQRVKAAKEGGAR